tara:strand:- start:1353 stop:2414 length:1062 start_codon:yes stop_codon:yes gene_type:complete
VFSFFSSLIAISLPLSNNDISINQNDSLSQINSSSSSNQETPPSFYFVSNVISQPTPVSQSQDLDLSSAEEIGMFRNKRKPKKKNAEEEEEQEEEELPNTQVLTAIKNINIKSLKRKHNELEVIEEEEDEDDDDDFIDLSANKRTKSSSSSTSFATPLPAVISLSSNKRTKSSSNSAVATPIHFQDVVVPPAPVFVEELNQSQVQKDKLQSFIELNTSKVYNPSEIVLNETINIKMLIAIINCLKNKHFAPEYSSFKFLSNNISREDYISKLEIYKSQFQILIHNTTGLSYGVKETVYKQKDLKEGRFYSQSMSLQNLPKVIRHAISNYLYDIDMVNCKNSFILTFNDICIFL